MDISELLEIQKELVAGIEIADGFRYLSAAGLVCLLYDHIITFPEEVGLIWRAPSSFAKFAFLLNRYMVIASLITVNFGFAGIVSPLTDTACRLLLLVTSFLAVISIGFANLLILLRVLLLWDKERHILIILVFVWLISFCTTTALMTILVVDLAPSVRYQLLPRICTVEQTAPTLIAIWAVPMVFEITVFVATVYNAISRPRTSKTALVSILHHDGAVFFFTVTCLRIVNLAFASTQNPKISNFPVYFTWALITITVHRLLLRIRAAEVRSIMYEIRAKALELEDWPTSPAEGPTKDVNGRNESPFSFSLALASYHDSDMMDLASKVPFAVVDIQMFYR